MGELLKLPNIGKTVEEQLNAVGIYTKEDLKMIDQALLDGCGYDAPGSYISWLIKRKPVHAMIMPGSRYDIGNLESYEKVKKTYKGVTR